MMQKFDIEYVFEQCKENENEDSVVGYKAGSLDMAARKDKEIDLMKAREKKARDIITDLNNLIEGMAVTCRFIGHDNIIPSQAVGICFEATAYLAEQEPKT